MRANGFDQLPVLSPHGSGRRLIGLVTLGNLLSRISHGRATGRTPVSDVMFDFRREEVSTEPWDVLLHEESSAQPSASKQDKGKEQKNRFVEITMDTPLSALNRFFEWRSACVVTERVAEGDSAGEEKGVMKPVAVVTKVDLLSWLVRENKLG